MLVVIIVIAVEHYIHLSNAVDVKLVEGKVLEIDYKLADKYRPEPFFEPSTLYHDADQRYSYQLIKYCNPQSYRDCIYVASLKFEDSIVDMYKVVSGQLPEVYPYIDVVIPPDPLVEPLTHKVMLRMTNKDCKIRTYVKMKTEFGEFIPFATKSCEEDEDYVERLWVKDQWELEKKLENMKTDRYGMFSLFDEKENKPFLDTIKPIVGNVEVFHYQVPTGFDEKYSSKCAKSAHGSTYMYQFSRYCDQQIIKTCVNVVFLRYKNEIVETFKVTSDQFTIATLNSIDVVVPGGGMQLGIAHKMILRMSDRRCLVRSTTTIALPTMAQRGLPVMDTGNCEDDKDFRDNYWVKEQWDKEVQKGNEKDYEGPGKERWANTFTEYTEDTVTIAELEDLYPFEVGIVQEFGYKKPSEYGVKKAITTDTLRSGKHIYTLQSGKYCTHQRRVYMLESCVYTVTLALNGDLVDTFKVSSMKPMNIKKSISVVMPLGTKEDLDNLRATVITAGGTCKLRTYKRTVIDEAVGYKPETTDCTKPPQTISTVKPVTGEVAEVHYKIPANMKEQARIKAVHPYDDRYVMVLSKHAKKTASAVTYTCILMLKFNGVEFDQFKMASCDVSRATWGSVDIVINKITISLTPRQHKVIVRKDDRSCMVITYSSWVNREGMVYYPSGMTRCEEDHDYRDNEWVREECTKTVSVLEGALPKNQPPPFQEGVKRKSIPIH